MKLQFKHQKFQADAAKAVVDVFAGQPYLTPSYMMDRGTGTYQMSLTDAQDFTGWGNQRIVPELNNQIILDHIQKIQRANQIEHPQGWKVHTISQLKWRQVLARHILTSKLCMN